MISRPSIQRIAITAMLTGMALFAVSCDPICQWDYHVANQTDSVLFVRYNDFSNTQIVTVPARQTSLVHTEERIGGLGGPSEDFRIRHFDLFEVVKDTAGGSRIQKDATSLQSWNYEAVRTGRFGIVPVGINRYTLVVQGSDY